MLLVQFVKVPDRDEKNVNSLEVFLPELPNLPLKHTKII
jgi:hypothetical protein